MILRLLLLTVLLGAVGAWLYFVAEAPQPGYVLIAFDGFRFESSLWFTLGLLLGLWLLWRSLWWLLALTRASGRVVNPWSRRNRGRRLRLAAEQGQLDLAEGRWSRALRDLKRAAQGEQQPLVHYLGAARAAHELGQVEESERLLELALERQPQAELAIALAHAQMQRSRGDLPAAQETLEAMAERYPGRQAVLRPLLEVLSERGDWSAVLGLLDSLRKNRVLQGDELAQVEQDVWAGRLRDAGRESGGEALRKAWQQLTKAQHQDPRLLAVYAVELQQQGAEAEAEELLHAALKKGYEPGLVALYSTLHGRDPARQLKLAEGWLKAHPQDAGLLLALGRLCLQNRLWGKAREYFETSLSFARSAEACTELARLLASLGEMEQSNRYYREAMELLQQHLPRLPLPAQS